MVQLGEINSDGFGKMLILYWELIFANGENSEFSNSQTVKELIVLSNDLTKQSFKTR